MDGSLQKICPIASSTYTYCIATTTTMVSSARRNRWGLMPMGLRIEKEHRKAETFARVAAGIVQQRQDSPQCVIGYH